MGQLQQAPPLVRHSPQYKLPQNKMQPKTTITNTPYNRLRQRGNGTAYVATQTIAFVHAAGAADKKQYV
jgi:hypothetical protein